MPLQFVKSKKGRDQLLYEGYRHTKERVAGNKTFWKCAIYHKGRCPGRAHTCDDHVIKYKPHCHLPSKGARAAKRIGHSRKATIPSGPQLTHRVVPTSGGLPETLPAKKLCIQNPKQTMQRLKECLSAARQGMCHSQTSAMVPESVPEDPSSVLSVTPPNSHECTEGFKDDRFMASSMLCEEPKASDSVHLQANQEAWRQNALPCSPMLCEEPKASHSVHLQASQEAWRQKFRSGTVPPGANPQEILSWISEAAQQWLCPQEHDKDQIVDMVILEQFLAVLPVNMRAWVKAREPRSSVKAVWLAETYLGDQELAMADKELEKDLVTFEDISVHFSEEEWALLNPEEKTLYWNVMHQNYDNVAWLSWGTGSKREKEPFQEASESIVEMLKKSNKEISWGVKQDSIRENNLERQPKSSSVENNVGLFISGLKEITRDAERGLETVYACCGYRKGEESSSIVGSRKSPRDEDAEPTILSGELQETSEKKIRQNPEENLIEGQNDVERQQSNNPRIGENLIPFRKALRDDQDSKAGQGTLCMAVDGGVQDESLTLLHDQNITTEDDLECVTLPEGSLFISEEISQSPEKDSQPEPIHAYSFTELNRTYCGENVNGTAALTSQKTIILDREQISSPGKEGGEATSVLSRNGLSELTEDLLLLHSQPTPEPQPTGPNPEESSECNSSQNSQGEELFEGPSNKRHFIQSSASTTQPTCSDSGGNSSSLSVLVKHRRFYKKRKPCSGRNIPVRSVLGTQWRISPGGKLHKHLNWTWWASRKRRCRFPELQMGLRKNSSVNINAQPHETLQTATEEHRTTSEAASSSDTMEAKPWQRAPSSPLLDKMAADPIVAHILTVLEQIAADTAEIKSVVSRLHPTVADIQNTLKNLSGCTVDAEHWISDLEFPSQNTKAQLVQCCNDIKVIEAKLVGKAVQTNAIAGLWPSLGIKREMCP